MYREVWDGREAYADDDDYDPTADMDFGWCASCEGVRPVITIEQLDDDGRSSFLSACARCNARVTAGEGRPAYEEE